MQPPLPSVNAADRPARCALSVVIPMYREADRIGQTLRDAAGTLRGWGVSAEILAVDDGSTDLTVRTVHDVAREVGLAPAGPLSLRVIEHGVNRGKGAAVRTGLSEARGAWVLMMDADNSARLAELPRLLDAARRSSSALAVGSRVAPGCEVKADPRRKAIGLVFRIALAALGLGYVRDTQCGFKLYRRDAAEFCATHAAEDGFAFDIEHIGLCTRAGLGVVETGIAWEHRDGGTIRVVRDGVKMLGQAVRIRARLRSASVAAPLAARRRVGPMESELGPAEPVLELKPLARVARVAVGSGTA